MEKGTVVRVEKDADKRAAFAALERFLEGTDGAQRRALLLLVLEATK